MLHGGAGSAAMALVNTSPAPQPLNLQAGPFTDDTSQSQLGKAEVTFTRDTGAPLPTFVNPGTQVQVEVKISGLTGTGTASAPVFNQGGKLGRLEVVAADAPMNFSVSGPGSPAQPLTLVKGGTDALVLRNNDGIAYTLDWSLQLGSEQMQSGELEIAPHGTSRINLLPGNELYSWTDDIRPASKTAHLTLAMQGPPEISPNMMPSRTLPVSLVMRSLSYAWTTLWSYVFVIVLLLIGGLLSLGGSAALPNEMRKNNLRRELDALSVRVNNISGRVDLYLRTLLRMERARIRLRLKRARMISPIAAERLDSCAADIERLRRRLKLAERLDELQRKLDEATVSAPPSVVDGIYLRLQGAAVHLHSFALTGDEAHAASRILDAEETALAALDDADAQARAIAAGFRDLKTRQKFVPASYYSDLKAAVPGLFDLLSQPFDDSRNIPRQMLFAVDFGVSAVQAAFDFAILRSSAPVSGTTVANESENAVPSVRERLVARQAEFVALLGTLSWASLREMRSLLREMRENIYEEDLLEAVNTRGQAEIVRDPRTVHAWQPVNLFIRFADARLNDAEALRRLSCQWEFPGEMVAQDWKVCHFFRKGGNPVDGGWGGLGVPVSVRVESRKPDAAIDGKAAARPGRNLLSADITLEKASRPSYSLVYAEAVRFFIALGVALAALLAGALDQVNRMGFVPAAIAILLIGFGADTVKNFLTQSSRKVAD